MARSALLCLALPTIAEAQRRDRCTLVPQQRGARSTTIETRELPSGERNTFIGGGVFVRCPAKELTLIADSLEAYGDEGRLYLLGNVRYDEPRLKLTSDFLTDFQTTERMLATGHVVATLPSGSTLEGPNAEYFRAIPNARPFARLHATGRPTITIVDRDTTAPRARVIANNVTMFGDSLVYAGGQVIATREDVILRGDSMDLDTVKELTVLMRGPSIEGRRERPYTLRGQRIELSGRARKLSRVISMGFASATSEDMTLVSDTIEIRVADDLIQRAIAWGPSRAKATSLQQGIQADSIDVHMPGQRLLEMHAVRAATADGRPDSTRFRADTVDWMRGDTIVARFDTAAAPGDTVRRARLRELTAEGRARSYYHMPPADSSVKDAAINYVTGREIIVAFRNQQVQRVTVLERASGVYLEPKRPAAAPAAAPAARPDSTRPPPTPAVRPPRPR